MVALLLVLAATVLAGVALTAYRRPWHLPVAVLLLCVVLLWATADVGVVELETR